MRKSVLIVTPFFPPINCSAVYRIIRMIKFLSEKNFEISIITIDERTIPLNFNYDNDLLNKIPDDVKIYRIEALPVFQYLDYIKRAASMFSILNYKKSLINANEKYKNMQIYMPINNELNKNSSIIQKLKNKINNYLTIPDLYAFWIPVAYLKALKIIKKHNIKNIISTSPPGSSHITAYLLKKTLKLNWIADFRDPWTKTEKLWESNEKILLKKTVNRFFEKKTLENANYITFTTNEMKNEYSKMNEKLITKSEIVTNGFDPNDLIKIEAIKKEMNFCKRDNQNDSILFVHAGNLYSGRTPIPFLHAWGSLIKSGKLPRKAFCIKFIGSHGEYIDKIIDVRDKFNLQNQLILKDMIPHKEAYLELAQADVLLLLQPGTRLQIPAKLYEYIIFGKPILAISPFGSINEIIEKNDLGWWADSENIESIKKCLIDIYKSFLDNHNDKNKNKIDISKFDGVKVFHVLLKKML